MWSNDYPHQNSTWPNSRQVIERDMAEVKPEDRRKLLFTNCEKLYNLKVPASLPVAA
jgi:predicted TIM-barrel fold metal-dependent hydrolase